MRRNNIVLINGMLAQETVRVEGWGPGSALSLFIGVDADDPRRGGRHFILVFGEKAQVTCSYLAAAEGAPLKVAVIGSLLTETRGGKMISRVDVGDISFDVPSALRRKAVQIFRQGAYGKPRPGTPRPVDGQYHNCVYMSGILSMRSLAENEVDGQPALTALIETDEPGAGGLHKLAFLGRPEQEYLRALQAQLAGPREGVEVGVLGTLYTVEARTTVMVARMDCHSIPLCVPGE